MSDTIQKDNSLETQGVNNLSEADVLRGQVNALKKELAELSEKHKSTVTTLSEIQEERDIYHRSLIQLLRRDDITFTEEELKEAMANIESFADLCREIFPQLQGHKFRVHNKKDKGPKNKGAQFG